MIIKVLIIEFRSYGNFRMEAQESMEVSMGIWESGTDLHKKNRPANGGTVFYFYILSLNP